MKYLVLVIALAASGCASLAEPTTQDDASYSTMLKNQDGDSCNGPAGCVGCDCFDGKQSCCEAQEHCQWGSNDNCAATGGGSGG